jgi:hypothetical protein
MSRPSPEIQGKNAFRQPRSGSSMLSTYARRSSSPARVSRNLYKLAALIIQKERKISQVLDRGIPAPRNTGGENLSVTPDKACFFPRRVGLRGMCYDQHSAWSAPISTATPTFEGLDDQQLGMICRTYAVNGRREGLPSREMLRNAIREVQSGGGGASSAQGSTKEAKAPLFSPPVRSSLRWLPASAAFFRSCSR